MYNKYRDSEYDITNKIINVNNCHEKTGMYKSNPILLDTCSFCSNKLVCTSHDTHVILFYKEIEIMNIKFPPKVYRIPVKKLYESISI